MYLDTEPQPPCPCASANAPWSDSVDRALGEALAVTDPQELVELVATLESVAAHLRDTIAAFTVAVVIACTALWRRRE